MTHCEGGEVSPNPLPGVFAIAVSFALLLTLAFAPMPTEAASSFTGGNGTDDDPYEISNWTQLDAVNDDLGAHYVLVDDLTQETEGYTEYGSTTANDGAGWAPIGPKFTGTFDGQGHTIDGLYIDRASTSEIGLFEIIGPGGEVRNLRVTNVNLTGAGLTGGLAGRNDGLIENSSTTGVVEGGTRTGGLAGINKAGTIRNSYSGAEVISDDAEIGGLAGKNANIIKKSYSFGLVDDAGTGADVGGLIGKDEGTTDDSFWDTEASGQTVSGGGTGKTTSEMQDVATFTDTATTGLTNPWDFVDDPNDDTGTEDIWNIAGSINDGYPYLIVDLQSAETGDANGDGTVDTITATFTESVADSSVSTGDFTLSTGTVDSVSTGATADDDTVILSVSGLPTGDTSATPDVTLSASSVTDLAGNVGPSTDTTVTASDGASPVMLSAVTGDADGDGHLDRVTMTYSEGVTAASTDVGDYDIGGTTYSGESIVTDDDGDATLVFGVTELGSFDTGATPDVAYAQGATADAGGNLMASQTITDTADGAVPVLVSTVPTDGATGVSTGTNLEATFSESVVAGSGNVEIRQSADDTLFETIGITDSGKVSISGDTVTIDPDGTLSEITSYYVLIDGTAIEDASTNSFGGISDTTTWNFETADTAAPSVTVDQPNGGERLMGGSTYDIQWTATDDDGIATDSIDLAYSPDGGTTWTNIATGEADDGTYTWTVPSIDSTTVLVRVQATDATGNTGQDVSDSPFEIDSTVPDLQGAVTGDANGDGTVDEITATFTESVADSSVDTGDFSLSTGSVDSVSNGTTADDDTVILSVSGLPSEDTSTTPDVTLLADSVTDLSENTGPSTDTTVTATDGASPVMLSAVTGDADGNGHLDRVTVTYSEGVTAASTDVADYDIGGATYEGESIVTDDDGDATLVFGVTELGTFDTGATPDVAYAQGTTADGAGNLAPSQPFNETTDGAVPVRVSTSPVDDMTNVNLETDLAGTFSETIVVGSGTIDVHQTSDDSLFESIDVTNTGKVTVSGKTVTANPAGTLSGLTSYYVLIDGTAIDDKAGNSYAGISATTAWNFETADPTAPSVTVDGPNGGEHLAGGSTREINWTATDDGGVAADGIALWYSTDGGTTWTSIATGEANDGTYDWTVPTVDSQTALVRVEATDDDGKTGQDVSDSTFEIDSTVPELAGATTADVAGDGTVDRVMVTFREPVDDGSIATADFSLSTGTVEAVATGATADDASVVLTVSGLATNDTSVIPSVTVAASSVADLAGNAGPSTDTTVTASDGAAPVLLSGVTDDGDENGQIDRVTLTFSEGVTGKSTNARDYDIVGYDGETIMSDDGDETLNVTVVESGTAYGDATPEVTYTRGTSADAWGNLVANRTIRARDGVGDDDGGNGGGGGGGGLTVEDGDSGTVINPPITTDSDGEMKASIPSADAGDHVSADFSAGETRWPVELTQLEFDIAEDSGPFEIDIIPYSEDPMENASGLSSSRSLGYFRVDPIAVGDNTTDNVSLRFRIDQSVLPDGQTSENVVLHRFRNETWHPLSTHHIEEDQYRSTSPGFSVFAVGTAQPRIVVQNVTVSPRTVAIDEAGSVVATVRNEGVSGNDTLTFEAGPYNETRLVYVESGTTRQVNFTASFNDPGTVDVLINWKNYGTITIENPQTETSSPAETPSATATPDNTTTATSSEAATPLESTPTPGDEDFFLSLSGIAIFVGVILGVILIGYYVVRRRRREAGRF